MSEPGAYGLTWDASVVGPFDTGSLERELAALAENDDVRAVARLSVVPMRLGGGPLQTYGLEPFASRSFMTVLDGAAPRAR